MTVLYTRWRFDNYKKRRILHSEKIMKKFVKLCLHSSYIVQNSFHFEEFFSNKIQDSNFGLYVTKMTSSGNFVYFWY